MGHRRKYESFELDTFAMVSYIGCHSVSPLNTILFNKKPNTKYAINAIIPGNQVVPELRLINKIIITMDAAYIPIDFINDMVLTLFTLSTFDMNSSFPGAVFK